MIKLKLKSTGNKPIETSHNNWNEEHFNEISKIYDERHLEVKDKQFRTSGKRVVYTSKGGKRAIFDSINLAALIFGVDASSVRARLNGPTLRRRKDDWLKGGKIEYVND